MAQVEVTVPVYGMTDNESYVQRWLVDEGSLVAAGTPLAVIETAKAELEIEAPVAGTVGSILVPADSEVPPGTKLTWIEETEL
jgi:pyruvate/2-oxoglutarate dehydrogenase complex dihydrolipoamide acyltransferase (E2) component